MKFFPNTRTIVEIGPITIGWYAVLILTGAFFTYCLIYSNFKKKHYPLTILDDLFVEVLFFGVLGTRLWYVLFSSDLMGYLSNPIRIIAFWEGGLAIHGGLFAGLARGLVYFIRHRWSFWPKADEVFPNVLVAQALGRWGNFVNQEAYGSIVAESFFDYYPKFIKDRMFIDGHYRMPTFLFESVLNIIGWVLIHFVLKRNKNLKEGDLVYAYLMWYGVVRFFVEGFRSDSLMFMGMRIAQIISLIFIVLGIMGYLGVFRKYIFKPKKPILLFDFDATIANTEPQIMASFEHVFSLYPPEIPLDEIGKAQLLGMPLGSSFEKYLPSQDPQAMIECYREHNKAHYHTIEPMDQVKETLAILKEEGYRMGIVSSKTHDMVYRGLEIIGMEKDFECIIGLDQVKSHKPNPEGIIMALRKMKGYRDNALYIGDTINDVQAGINASCFTVGYTKNPLRMKSLLESEADRVMVNFSELTDILKEKREWTHQSSMMS